MMTELLTTGLANWLSALPLTIPLILLLAAFVATWERRPRR
jgi:hypothetical protein